MKLPTKIVIFSLPYTIKYFDNIKDVDSDSEENLWGNIEFNLREIRIYKGNRSIESTFQTLLHEIIHAIVQQLNIEAIQNNKSEEAIIDQLATGILEVCIRNKFILLE